jgi:hypothetical protein
VPFLDKDVLNYLIIYFKNQLISSVLGHREIVGNRYDPILKTIREIIVPILFLLLITFLRKQKMEFNKLSLKFLILSLFGVFPLMISPKQMDWYVYPSFPFFSITITLIFKNTLIEIEKFFQQFLLKIVLIFIMILLLLTSFLNYGKIIKYNEFHQDFKNFKALNQRIVGVCPKSLINDWVLIALSQRYLKFSFKEDVDSVVFALKSCNIKCSFIYPSNPKNYYICWK